MDDNKIISISSGTNGPRKNDFEELMRRAEDKINQISRANPHAFYKIGAAKLEKESEQLIKSVCEGTKFSPDDVVLVSGHAFPDIQAGTHYGVEVKSTEGKTWMSTGSSIMESTRIAEINCIYMLFGKLGSNPPEFKCRPYESVLKGISVTHSPRYTIDMTLEQGETIFDQMGVTYDDFRLDEHKIDRVRDFYKKKNQSNSAHEATQWWLGKESPVNLEIMRGNAFDSERKKKLIAEMLILFDEIIDGEYGEAAAWLCTRKYIINPSFRDLFSAGGRVVEIDNATLPMPYPHIVGCILEHVPFIYQLLKNPDIDLLEDIKAIWQIDINKVDLLDTWLNRIEQAFSRAKSPKHGTMDLKNIDIVGLIKSSPHSIKYPK